MKRLATVCGFVACAGLSSTRANAQSTAIIQDNGLTCRSQGHEYGKWTRDFSGIKNIGTQTLRVFCPLSTPTYDTDPFRNPNISTLQIFFTGTAPTCWQYSMNQTGAVFNSANGSEDLGFFPRRITFANGLSASPGPGISIGYACNVPIGTTINGASFNSSVGPVVGGV